MKKFLMVSDWWTNILVGATSDAPNLDHPTNVATLQRLASRYDVCVIVAPFWHTVGTQVRDRLRTYAQAQGRSITCLRYMGSMYVQWHDQPGDMTLVPAEGRVSYTGVISNSDTMLKSGGTPMLGRGAIAQLMDPGSATALAAAKSNALTKAAGWDGIFIDEVVDYYTGFRDNTSQVADGYPLPPSLTYPNAKRDFVSALTAHLVANGKLVGANITPYVLPGGGASYPQQVCAAAPGLLYPFTEAEFGADWGRGAVGSSSGSWSTQMDIAGWLAWCEANGRKPIPNVYSNDPAVVRYGLGVFLAYAGQGAIFSAACPEASENEEYMREPTWLPDFATADRLGAASSAATGANLITRKYSGGRVALNPTSTTQQLTIDGYYQASGETAKTTTPARSVPALSATALEGDDFGTYRQVNGKKGRGHYMWGGGRWNRLVAPNEYTGPALPAGTAITADTFTGTDGAAWDAGKWASGMALSSATATIVGNRGQMKVGTATPGVRTQRFTGSQFADFHALLTFSLSSTATSLTVMFRSGDTTLDEDDAYGLRLWHDRAELLTFDTSYTGTQIVQVTKPHTPGQQFYLRLKAAGSTLQARTWLTSDTEPAAWDINLTNTAKTTAGWFGFSVSGYGAGGPNATVTVDDLTVAAS